MRRSSIVRENAERVFKQQNKETGAAKEWHELATNEARLNAKTARLKELRLARENADQRRA